jgi:DNA-binding winged helix-turn-helix (wHTH) protein/Tfp pilus assembly protein PilF
LIYEFGPFQLNATQRVLSLRGEPIALGPKAIETLVALIENAGHFVSKDELLARVWPEGFVEESNLQQNIYQLRKHLRGAFATDPIETLTRRGYRFNASVTILEQPGPNITAKRATHWHPQMRAVAIGLAVVLVAAITLLAAWRHSPGIEQLDAGSKKIYDLGNFYWQQRTATGEARAIDLFKQVVNRQPSSPFGYLGLSRAYGVSASYCFVPSECDADLRLARGMLAKAIALAPDLSDAHAVAGILVNEFDRDYKRGGQELQRAIALDPSNTLAHHWYGAMLYQERKFDAARVQLETASTQDPTSPVIAAFVAQADYFLRRYDDTISFAKQSLEMNPSRVDALAILGLAYIQQKNAASAAPFFDRLARAGFSDKARVLSAYANALRGNALAARAAVAKMEPTLRDPRDKAAAPQESYRYADEMDIAAVYFALGDSATAMTWLYRIKVNTAEFKAWIRVDPRFDRVRNDASFRAWLASRGTS